MTLPTKYYGYSALELRYNRSRKSLWRWWAKDRILPAPKRANGIFLGWTEEQLQQFEQGGL
jgi:prophage regulatory protein